MKKISEQIKGVASILLTPMKEDYSVDKEGFKQNIDFLIENGINDKTGFMVAMGTTGECYALTTEERKQTAELVVEKVNGRLPIFISCNNESTDKVLNLAKHAEKIGADGVMIIPPYYRILNEDNIYDFYKEICDNINLPILVYNNPSVTQIDLSVQLMKKLAKLDNIAGLKECTLNCLKLEKMVRHLNKEISVLNGSMEGFEPYATMIGTNGFVSGIVNFAPKTVSSLAESILKGNLKEAKMIQKKIVPFLDLYFDISANRGGNFSTTFFKEAMKVKGLAAGPTRHPALNNISQQEHMAIEKVLNFE